MALTDPIRGLRAEEEAEVGVYDLTFQRPMLALLLGVISVLERKPSVVQHAARVLIAAGFGALLGTGVYSDGVQDLLAGPAVILLVPAIFRTIPHVSLRGHRIALEMSIIAGITAVGVGLTIFL